VRNRSDGSVEALALGAPGALDELTAWARRGPPAARVAEVKAEPAAEPEPRPAGFELRPSV
jgi:acylphosphatase